VDAGAAMRLIILSSNFLVKRDCETGAARELEVKAALRLARNFLE
jgi:hypothetical protein